MKNNEKAPGLREQDQGANDQLTGGSGTTVPPLLDWRHAHVGDPLPCVSCRRPALLRDPDTGKPRHKVCAEREVP